MDGYGVCKYTDGRMYYGMYKNHQKHGQGVYVWADGRKYDGKWSNGV